MSRQDRGPQITFRFVEPHAARPESHLVPYRFHSLVALPPAPDLLLCAKHLFVEAMGLELVEEALIMRAGG